MSIEENGHKNGEIDEVSAREDAPSGASFDGLARGLATGTVPRRKALRMLAAALFGGAFVAAPAVAVAAPKPGGTGCPKPGEIRVNGKCQCNTAEGLVTCGPSDRCVDPDACGGGQHVDTETCKCECDNPGEILCNGTCVPSNCPSGQTLNTSSCTCECRNDLKVIVGGQCVCRATITCGTGEQVNPDTCACECAPGFLRCGGNCVPECLEGFVLKNCECVPEVTCLDICAGCCDQGECLGGGSNSACGTAGGPCDDCAARGQVCVNGECKECATNADCATNVNNAQAICKADNTCDFECSSGFTLIDGACCANANVCGGVCLTSGCCQAGSSQPGNTNAACGTSGGTCAVCGTGQTCTNGTCQTTSTCRTAGQSCNPGNPCCSGLTCQGSGSSRTCVAV